MSTSHTVSGRDYGRLFDMISAPIKTRLLQSGLDLGVFDRLKAWITASEAAKHIGIHPKNAVPYLDALTCIGLLEKQDGRYRNAPEAESFLCADSPAFLGPLLAQVSAMCVDPLDDLTGLLRNGPQEEPQAFGDENLWPAFTRDGAGWVRAGVGEQMAAVLAALPEFPAMRKMLDLGGGHGLFAQAFVRAHPSMTAIVFDRAPVLAVAEEFIRENGMQDRVSVLAGDYLTGGVGSGYDLVWACSTLNFARHDLDALSAKIHAALNPGGLFVSFQDGLTHERTQPETLLPRLGVVLATGQDMYFDQGEIARSMLGAGFISVHSRTIATPMGELDLDIARKGWEIRK